MLRDVLRFCPFIFFPGLAFSQSPAANVLTAAATQSGLFTVECIENVGPTAFTLNLDDAFFGIGLTPVELQGFSVE